MSASATNNIWEKVELALVRFVNNASVGVNEANIYAGHDNAQKQTPHIVCDCHDGDPETLGRPTGNWICRATITVTTKLHDETGMDNSGRFASIMDSFVDLTAKAALSDPTEFFTVFQSQITSFSKRIQGDELVCEINLTLTCCGSVIA